jgi:N-carbamoylputrescine amidase
MKSALVIHHVGSDHEANVAEMVSCAEQAAQAGAALVLFPEAALTGLINNGDPLHDLPLGQSVPGPLTERLAAISRQYGVYIGSGLLERDGNCLYDTAVLLNASGEIALKYRRIQPQWHGKNADPAVYRQGDGVTTVVTPFGRVGFLICGDLFDDGIVAELCALHPDYVLFPFARCFDSGAFDQDRWDTEEQAEYIRRASRLHCTVLMVNQLEDPSAFPHACFGGALIVSPTGDVVTRWPLGRDGILYADL